MLRIKRLYTFIIQTFLPVFVMTFAICLFIVLMQFIWRYVEDFVGKGLDNLVLAELFLYAALSLVPMALPLSLLLASLMAFGNLGERMELLAIKAAGVSLLRAMSPLIILVACIAIGGFFYQNEAMPRIQVKFRSLLLSIKQKSPELDIPEGSFYSGIPNYSLYVKEKDKKTKMLRDVMIYDTSKGFDNMAVIVCDSASMTGSEDKTFVLLNLYHGQQFANFRQADLSNTRARNNTKFVPYSRENFKEKEVIISFNTGFDRMDESNLEGTQISKNITQLSRSIDSMTYRLDSINIKDRQIIGKHTYLTYRANQNSPNPPSKGGQVPPAEEKKAEAKAPVTPIDYDSLLNSFSKDEMMQYLNSASNEAENSRVNIIERTQKKNLQKNIRFHMIERHQKFTLSFACLIFFFIGAPLGAIIRKGGLGMPVVVSVCLFIIYYIINNIGYKMARDGVWEVWQGMWLSSAVLFPLGVFLTYKAMNDSTLFNPEAYSKFFRKILFIKSPAKISDEEREAIIHRIPDVETFNMEPETLAGLQAMDSDKLRDIIQNYKSYGYDKGIQLASLSILKSRGAEINDIIDKQDKRHIDAAESLYNTSSRLTIAAYVVFIILFATKLIGIAAILIYVPFYARSMMYYSTFYKDIKSKSVWYHVIIGVLSFTIYPLIYFFVKKEMDKDKKELEIIKFS